MHELMIVYRELTQAVLWKLSEGFQWNFLGHFCIREPEILQKKGLYRAFYLGKYLKMDDSLGRLLLTYFNSSP